MGKMFPARRDAPGARNHGGRHSRHVEAAHLGAPSAPIRRLDAPLQAPDAEGLGEVMVAGKGRPRTRCPQTLQGPRPLGAQQRDERQPHLKVNYRACLDFVSSSERCHTSHTTHHRPHFAPSRIVAHWIIRRLFLGYLLTRALPHCPLHTPPTLMKSENVKPPNHFRGAPFCRFSMPHRDAR